MQFALFLTLRSLAARSLRERAACALQPARSPAPVPARLSSAPLALCPPDCWRAPARSLAGKPARSSRDLGPLLGKRVAESGAQYLALLAGVALRSLTLRSLAARTQCERAACVLLPARSPAPLPARFSCASLAHCPLGCKCAPARSIAKILARSLARS